MRARYIETSFSEVRAPASIAAWISAIEAVCRLNVVAGRAGDARQRAVRRLISLRFMGVRGTEDETEIE